MITLGFDTATAVSAVCLCCVEGGPLVYEQGSPAGLDKRPNHSAELLPRIKELLDRAGAGFRDLGQIAVGVGPGTYTGMRIGIATANALAQALSIPIRPFSTLRLLAAGMARELNEAVLAPVIDAKRGQLFISLYIREGEGLRRVRDEAVCAPGGVSAVLEISEAGETVVAGDGAIRYREEIERSGIKVAPAINRSHKLQAARICEILEATPLLGPGEVVPRYLRLPDAEINLRAGKLRQKK